MANQNVFQLTQQSGTANTTSVLYAGVTGTTPDTGLPISVLFNSPTITGSPTIAGYLSITTAASTYAPIASPTFTGTVTIPSGASISGYLTTASAATTYAPIASPTFTGTVTIPSGANISGYLTTTVAASTYAALTGAAFTGAVSVTGAFTPSQTNGIVGTTAANNANAGSVGEFASNSTTGTSLTTSTAANATSISLTAGDWDIWGTVYFNPAGTTTVSQINAGISTTSATLPSLGSYAALTATFTTGAGQILAAPMTRLSLSTTTTIYMVAQGSFATSTMTCNGYIDARRRR
jgi:hypothetical protein